MMRRLAFGCLALLCAACAPMGPQSVVTGRPAYNQAVQQTNDQELLLNLVRMRYRDTLYFTSVERIAAAQEFNQGFAAGVSGSSTHYNFPGAAAANTVTDAISRTLNLGAGAISLNEKPTIFYAPIEGEKFVRQMMTPMNPDLLLMLVRSGWSIDRVFAVGVQEINGLKNAPTAAGPTPELEPEFRDFREAVHLLAVLQRDQLIELARAPGNEAVELRFTRNANRRKETARLRTLLGLDAGRDSFSFGAAPDVAVGVAISISTRPLMSALSYLAQGITVPAADVTAGKVKVTKRADGHSFDWEEMLDGVFHVDASSTPPADPAVVIPYRGSYFYIADNDLETKSTFMLLTQLMALHSAPAPPGPAMSFSFGR